MISFYKVNKKRRKTKMKKLLAVLLTMGLVLA